MKKKITAGILLLLLLAGGCAQPAYANSAQRHWSGTDVTGAVVTGEDCPIVVERELLTFDVQEFPEQYYPDTDSFLAYTGKVTAEYTFRNPADYTVTATLVFPFGNPPHYGEYIYDQATGRPFDVSDALKYGVTLDGKPIEAAVRHTLKARHTSFSLDEDLPKLADSYICDSFFVPDMPVRVQRYSVTGIDKEYGAATAAFVINADSAKTRVLCEKQTGGARLKKGSQASCWVQNGDTITVYIFGELPKEELIWTLYENGACEKVIEGTVSSEFSEMTFKDYALRGYDENSGILESDWYNAQVELLRLGSEIWGNRPGGSVRVSVAQEPEKLLIRVSDNGCGIPEEYQQSIFQPFFRVDKSRSREYGGAGLGLSLVWEIADIHGGSVRVEESSKNGTVIAAEFPIQYGSE